MPPKSLNPTSRHHSNSIDSCLFHLHSWRPFYKPLHPDPTPSVPHNLTNPSNPNGLHTKRPCLSDRATSLFSLSIDALDFSRLSLFDDALHRPPLHLREKFRGKRRRRGSRSVSGRSSDTRNGRCSVGGGAATATCSDFMVAGGGTDSSGELFANNGWVSDVSEARRDRDKDREREKEREGFGVGYGFEVGGNESGYGSEPGYRGDAELGYGDEVDDDDEDGRLVLWGERFEDNNMEMVGENTFTEQKSHHRGRRKKHDLKMADSSR